MPKIYFAARPAAWEAYEAPLRRALAAAGIAAELSPHCADPAEVDYIIYAPGGPLRDFTPFTRARAVLSLWAGVERIVGDPSLTQPLTRMVDTGLQEGMVEYVTGHVLRHHLGIDQHLDARNWAPAVPPLARHRPVTILGLGALGAACGQALAALNFPVTGWSRRPKTIPGLTCLAGDEGLAQALGSAQILVLLLPLTAQTQHLMNTSRLAQLPRGAVILNPGRGGLIDDDALLAALDQGKIAHATLDTFQIEPLPQDHPFWAHPQVTITPHIASETRPETAAEVIAENIRRAENGAPLLHLVDRAAGY